MTQSSSNNKSGDRSSEAPPPSITQTLQSTPAAVKRSMPMALSILLGILLASLAAWFFQTLVWLILLLYLSFVAATVLEVPVNWLILHGFRRGFAAVVIMVGGLVIIAVAVTLLANSIYNQTAALSSQLQQAPAHINNFVNELTSRYPHFAGKIKSFDISDIAAQILPDVSSLWRQTLAGFALISSIVIAFFIVLYMLIDGPSHLKAARGLLPKSVRLDATRLFHDLAHAHRAWVLASLINVTSASILISTGLYVTGVPGAIILGVIAGLGELIPNVGPFFGALPALFVSFLIAPQLFLYVAGMFVVVQTIQSYGISPLVLKFSIKLPVLGTIISVLVMGELFGLMGILVAIPMVTDLVVCWNLFSIRREKDSTDYDCVNTPADGTRNPVAKDQAHPLRKIFHRSRTHSAAYRST